jgi:AFG3 family protein
MDGVIGRVSYGHREGEDTLHKPFSEKTGEMLDAQVRHLVVQVHKRATEVLSERRADLDKIAELLLEREVISRFVYFTVLKSIAAFDSELFMLYREDMIGLIGPRPFENADDLDRALGYGKKPEDSEKTDGAKSGGKVGRKGGKGADDDGHLPTPGLAAIKGGR